MSACPPPCSPSLARLCSPRPRPPFCATSALTSPGGAVRCPELGDDDGILRWPPRHTPSPGGHPRWPQCPHETPQAWGRGGHLRWPPQRMGHGSRRDAEDGCFQGWGTRTWGNIPPPPMLSTLCNKHHLHCPPPQSCSLWAHMFSSMLLHTHAPVCVCTMCIYTCTFSTRVYTCCVLLYMHLLRLCTLSVCPVAVTERMGSAAPSGKTGETGRLLGEAMGIPWRGGSHWSWGP